MIKFLTTALLIQKKLNLRDIDGLITNTYMFAILSAIVMLGLAILIASMIKFQSGSNPKDRMKRKVWFWIIGVSTPVLFYVYNLVLVIPTIKAGPAMNKFMMHSALSPVISFIVYLILGITVSKIFKRKKIGNWFNKAN